jgi:hypothetical protein
MIRALLLLCALLSPSAFAADGKPSGPPLVDLMMLPNHAASWKVMLGDTKVPAWVESFAKTLDGPNIPSIDLLTGGKIYTLGFTCEPNDCEQSQLYVLFNGDGSQAWGMLLEGEKRVWLGNPDQSIKDAILGRLEQQ